MSTTDSTQTVVRNPLTDLTGFQSELLVAIRGLHEKPNGQEIQQRWEAQNEEETTHGRLYPNLDTLVEKGFVSRGEIDRRTNYYALTDDGREALEEYREFVEA